MKWARDNVARYGGDPKRISLAGHSAGAYQAAMLSLDRQYLAAAGVDPAIVRAAALLADPDRFLPLDRDPRPRRTWRLAQPARDPADHFRRADAPPMLLMHGTADTIVRPYNSERLSREA